MMVMYDGNNLGFIDTVLSGLDEYWVCDEKTSQVVVTASNPDDDVFTGGQVKAFKKEELVFTGAWTRSVEGEEEVALDAETLALLKSADEGWDLRMFEETGVFVLVEPPTQAQPVGKVIFGPGFVPTVKKVANSLVQRVAKLRAERQEAESESVSVPTLHSSAPAGAPAIVPTGPATTGSRFVVRMPAGLDLGDATDLGGGGVVLRTAKTFDNTSITSLGLGLPWDTLVEGTDEGDGWIRLGDGQHFLSVCARNGKQVIFPATASEDALPKATAVNPVKGRWRIDHSCQSSTSEVSSRGLAYRLRPDIASIDPDAGVIWGETVVGSYEGEGWLRVGDKYLPMRTPKGLNVAAFVGPLQASNPAMNQQAWPAPQVGAVAMHQPGALLVPRVITPPGAALTGVPVKATTGKAPGPKGTTYSWLPTALAAGAQAPPGPPPPKDAAGGVAAGVQAAEVGPADSAPTPLSAKTGGAAPASGDAAPAASETRSRRPLWARLQNLNPVTDVTAEDFAPRTDASDNAGATRDPVQRLGGSKRPVAANSASLAADSAGAGGDVTDAGAKKARMGRRGRDDEAGEDPTPVLEDGQDGGKEGDADEDEDDGPPPSPSGEKPLPMGAGDRQAEATPSAPAVPAAPAVLQSAPPSTVTAPLGAAATAGGLSGEAPGLGSAIGGDSGGSGGATAADADGDGQQTVRYWAENQAQFADLAALKENWVRVRSSAKSGSKIYYVNIQSGEQTFTEPLDLPKGWTKQTSRSSGQVYYFNKMTGQNQFDKPVA